VYTRPDCNRLFFRSISSIIIMLVYPSFLHMFTGPTDDNKLVVFQSIHSGIGLVIFVIE
jgi:hypothetical protein